MILAKVFNDETGEMEWLYYMNNSNIMKMANKYFEEMESNNKLEFINLGKDPEHNKGAFYD